MSVETASRDPTTNRFALSCLIRSVEQRYRQASIRRILRVCEVKHDTWQVVNRNRLSVRFMSLGFPRPKRRSDAKTTRQDKLCKVKWKHLE